DHGNTGLRDHRVIGTQEHRNTGRKDKRNSSWIVSTSLNERTTLTVTERRQSALTQAQSK
ncbi:MAG: hypothetical protein M3R25_05065, partial [Bacteroidota bacterium]|nr:hypothetical protein [Bacteroidota bacterium]